jgi:plastocyanin
MLSPALSTTHSLTNSLFCIIALHYRINNKGGPHNVVFDEDAIPKGVDQEKISMDEQLGEVGDTFVMKFDEPGSYDFYCEPHRGAGMNGLLTVI